MGARHRILEDRDFWLTLEFDMSGRLSRSDDKAMRKYWIDGFIPESITDTNSGVDVQGAVWIAEGQKDQTKCRFLARVPQKLLHRTIQQFDFEIVCLDVEGQYLELNIWKQEPNQRMHQTPDGAGDP